MKVTTKIQNDICSVLSLISQGKSIKQIEKELSVNGYFVMFVLETFQIREKIKLDRAAVLKDWDSQSMTLMQLAEKYNVTVQVINHARYQRYFKNNKKVQDLVKKAKLGYVEYEVNQENKITNEELINLIQNGLDVKDIAKTFNVTKDAVYKRLKKLDTELSELLTKPQEARIKNKLRQGYTVEQLTKEYKISPYLIYRLRP